MIRAALLGMLVSGLLAAQGTQPRASAADYAVNGKLGELSIGAEYTVRSVPEPLGSTTPGMLDTPGYLIVEVAVFGPSGARVALAPDYFSLRVNGSKKGILAQPPFTVAYIAEAPPSDQSTGLTLGAGTGDKTIVYGRGARQPANPTTRRDAPPEPRPLPGVPAQTKRATPREHIQGAALPSGSDVVPPIAGVLYFAYADKHQSIKSLDLIYEGPAGKLELELMRRP